MGESIQPFKRQGFYTVFDNAIIDELMPRLKPNAWKVLCFVLRKTRGYHKSEDAISYSQIMAGTGIRGAEAVSNALKQLKMEGAIKCSPGSTVNGRDWSASTYYLNEDYEIHLPDPSSTSKIEADSTSEIEVGSTSKIEETNTLGETIENNSLFGDFGKDRKSPSGGKKKGDFQAPTQDDYHSWAMEVIEGDPLGANLKKLIHLAAGDNKTGKMRASRAYNDFAEPFRDSRGEFTDEAWRHGFDAALRAGAGNLNYVKKAARKYQMQNGASVSYAGDDAPAAPATPEPAVVALREHDTLSRYAQLAERWDFTAEGQPPNPIYMALGGTWDERGTVLTRIRSVAKRAVREAG